MIRLNGSIWVDDVELFFEDFEIELDEDLELPFDELIEDDFEEFDFDDEEDCCDGNCEDCEFDEDDENTTVEFDLDDDERFDSYTDDYKNFLSEYVRKIYDTDFCPYCIAEVLDLLVEDEF